MTVLRIATAVVTVLMSLMNLPFAFDDGGGGVPAAIAWPVTLFGVAGIAVAVALLRRAAWATWAAVAVGVLNLAGGVAALLLDRQGAVVGLTVSVLVTVLAVAHARVQGTRGARTA